LRLRLLCAFNGRLLFILKFIGRLLAILPVSIVAFICRCLGFLVELCLRSRCRITMRSLHHAFPEQSEAWRRKVFRESTARLFEMALFRPASAFFTPQRLNNVLEVCPDAVENFRAYGAGQPKHGQPVVIMLPHMTMSEAGPHLGGQFEWLPPIHVIFRPLNQPAINEWVTALRERHGAKMLSRQSGYNDGMAALRRGELVGVLFDQDASKKGTTITFMDRIVSATDLPGLMAHRFEADVYVMLLERTSFWRAKLTMTPIPLGESPSEVTIRAHDVLEEYLRRDDNSAADWLWLHDRWDHYFTAHKRFSPPVKRDEIALSNRIHGQASTPRKTRLWIRLPNWLGDVVMALPILRAIREGRQDFEFTLIGKGAFEPLVDRMGIADRFVALPDKGAGYFRAFRDLKLEYPDTYLLLTNSFRGDFEAYLTGCKQRFGMVRPGKRRPLLTNPFRLPEDVDETEVHQTEVWLKMAQSYGLKEELDFAPQVNADVEKVPSKIGLICGTENSPEKRWPISHWRELVKGILESKPEAEVVLYGTPQDREITSEVCEGFDSERVTNLAGQTNLAEFCDALSSCQVICCNDTGGMHLANMLGTSVVAVFGPTNPVRTGPIFSTAHTILQPEGCPKTGGMAIDGVSTERGLEAVLSALSEESA
jgi:heptosyltransferase II